MSKEYLTNDLNWHYRIDYRQLCLNPECFIYHSVLYFKLFSSMQIQPFGFLSGMHQAYLYFVWLKGLACLTNCSREPTGQCQRRNQMVLQNFSYLKVKFFILKQCLDNASWKVKFFPLYWLFDSWSLSWNSLHKLPCHTDTTAGHPISTRPKQWMNAKLYTPSKSYKNTNEFLYFCCCSADLVVRAVLKMSATLLKYHTFEGGFHGAKKYKIRVHVHFSAC